MTEEIATKPSSASAEGPSSDPDTQHNKQLILGRENPNNVFMQKSDVEKIFTKYGIGVPVNDIEYYRNAFVHRSYLKVDNVVEGQVPNCTVPLQDTCNERLELLGDCILGAVVGAYLFERFSDMPEGDITKAKTKIVRGKTLGKLGKRLGFGKWAIISLHVESEGGRKNIRILEDLFECFIGAIYLDNGGEPLESNWFELMKQRNEIIQKLLTLEEQLATALKSDSPVPKEFVSIYIDLVQQERALSDRVISTRSTGYLICERYILNVVETELDLAKLISLDDNYKDQIQLYFQKNFKNIFPEWEILNQEGPTNNRWHTMGIRDDRGTLIGTGRARKKIDAEQLASKNALKFLGFEVLSEDEDEDEDVDARPLTILQP